MSSTFKDLAASLVTSGYKWMTQTLYTAQQQFAVRPYFTAKILDDTIQPNAKLFNGLGSLGGNGSMVTAPDGSVLGAGLKSGNVTFFKSSDLHSVAGVWQTQMTIDTDATANDPKNQFSIAVSDWYKGTYFISIWYFYNFGSSGANLSLRHQYSLDGGLTWNTVNRSTSNLPNNALGNVSLAAMKPVWDGTNMNEGCFYIQANTNTFASGYTGYDVYYVYGSESGGMVNLVKWNQKNINSQDWSIHSISSFYLNGYNWLVLSGFRNIVDSVYNPNYSLWTSPLLNITQSIATDLWGVPIPVIPIGSSSTTNTNQFLYPSSTVSGSQVYITCQAITVDSVSQTATGAGSTVISSNTNYFMLTSDDGISFSYPTIMVFSDGSQFNSGSFASFVPQGNYWYLGGGAGYLWEFNQNNITADVTNDVLAYNIQDLAAQPSSISLQIGNQSNQWYGNSPTKTGYAAIAGNRKILLSQGYYNANGVAETVPRNIYYIDDIQQSVNSTDNSLTILARDWYKKLKTTVTKFSYFFQGPTIYSDIFDGSTNTNWNVISGTWTFDSATTSLESSTAGTIAFSQQSGSSSGELTSIYVRSQALGLVYFYAYYVDTNNYLRLELNEGTGAWAVVINVNGTPTTMRSGTVTIPISGSYYGIFVRRYDFYKFNFIYTYDVVGSGNTIGDYYASGNSSLLVGAGNGEYDISSNVYGNTTLQSPYTVAIGANGGHGFRFFQRNIYNSRNNVSVLMRKIAKIAGIFSFKLSDTFKDLLYIPNFTGTFTVKNRIMSIAAGNTVMSNANSYSNGEVAFDAKISVANVNNPAGFRFIFRSDSTSPTSAYYFHIVLASTGSANAPVVCRFERLLSSNIYQFFNTAYDPVTGSSASHTASLNIDLTKSHTFRIVCINGEMSAYLDDLVIAAWTDNNTTNTALTTGFWGFSADTNTTLSISNIHSPDFWKPIETLSFNPGDDAESVIDSLATSIRFWVFSDILGRFKALFLNSTDPSTYTYSSQLSQQNTDISDKEYVSQVTVYGSGVIATSRNLTVNPGFPVRESVVIDYSILTEKDAQTRADNEIIQANQYRGQYKPRQVINAGSELFDVITVTNTGTNTSGINSTSRVYSQDMVQGSGGHNADCFIELDTGNV